MKGIVAEVYHYLVFVGIAGRRKSANWREGWDGRGKYRTNWRSITRPAPAFSANVQGPVTAR